MKQDQPTNLWALAAVGITVVLWSSAFVVIRDVAPYFSPGALALGRLLAGSAALGLILLVRREWLPPPAAWPGILCAGVLWFGVYMVALNWAEQYVDAGTAALVINVGPILIALLSGWLLHEGYPPRLLTGLAVAFAGTILIGLASSGRGDASLLGVLLCLLAALGYAGGMVAQKPALRHASALQVTAFGCLVGTAACLPFTGRLVGDVAAAPVDATLGMIYLGLFPTALAFCTWAYALSRTTTGSLAVTTYIVPPLVVLMSWIFLGEVPGLLALSGGALCLVGVAVSRTKRPVPAAPPPAVTR